MKLFYTTLLSFFFIVSSYAQLKEVPVLGRQVVDQTGTLNSGEINQLINTLKDLESTKGSQVVVLVVGSTQPETIEQYSWRVAEQNEIGRKGTNDGVLLLVAKDDRKVRLEVGYGLEGAIPDALAKRIIEEQILPKFKQGDFFGGIVNGVQSIITLINGEDLPKPVKRNTKGMSDTQLWVLFLFFIPSMIFIEIMKKKLGKWKGWIVGTLIGYVVLILVLPFSVAITIQSIFAGISFFGMVFGSGSGGNTGGHGGYRGYSSGSFSGGGSFGLGGGFSGGGGSFGGGGASGGW